MNEDVIPWQEIVDLFESWAKADGSVLIGVGPEFDSLRIFDERTETRILENYGFQYEKYYLKRVPNKGIRIVKLPPTRMYITKNRFDPTDGK